MENGKQIAGRILSNLDFQVKDIHTGAGRTADLRVTDDDAIYVVEVKDKLEAEELTNERADVLGQDGLHEQCDLIAHDKRIREVLRYARKQLDDTPKAAGTYQLIWLHCDGIDDELRMQQAFATFYGHVKLVAIKPPQSGTKDCLYFDYNVSFEMPTVDALILTENNNFQFCVNEFSNRADDFRTTALYRKFLDVNGVFDPMTRVSAGRFIACRATIPRKDDVAIAKALQEQTGVLYSPIRFSQHAVSVAVEP